MNFAIVYCPFLEATEYEGEVQGLFKKKYQGIGESSLKKSPTAA
jgi:hypothetical protein